MIRSGGTPAGSVTSAVAWSIGNSQPLPVTFQYSSIVVGEEAELVVGPVRQRVGVRSRCERLVGVSEVDPHAVIARLAVMRLGLAVALHVDDLEAHLVAQHRQRRRLRELERIGVEGRKVAIDAVLDRFAVRHHLDCLGHGHAAVRRHCDAAVEVGDTFRGFDGLGLDVPVRDAVGRVAVGVARPADGWSRRVALQRRLVGARRGAEQGAECGGTEQTHPAGSRWRAASSQCDLRYAALDGALDLKEFLRVKIKQRRHQV